MAEQIVKDGLTQVQNAVKGKLDDVVNQVTGGLTLNKNFIHIRDFYNFIKSRSGQNAPTPFFYFSPSFYNGGSDVDLETGAWKEHSFFSDHLGEFARFRYCIQAIEFPSLSIKGYTAGVGGSTNGQMDITNLFGGHTILSNSFINADNHTLSMNILNTHKPVVENFIYPWMLEALRSSYGDTSPIPRVNMAVKYWSPNHITKNMEGIKPDFVYYVTGLFPIKINAHKPTQLSSESALQRQVQFSFNDFVILNSESDALKYNLGEFFIGNLVQNLVDKYKNKLTDKMNDAIDKLFHKLRKDDKKDGKKDKPEVPGEKENEKPRDNNSKGGEVPPKPESPNEPPKDRDSLNAEPRLADLENPANAPSTNRSDAQLDLRQAANAAQTPQSVNRNQLSMSNAQDRSVAAASTSRSAGLPLDSVVNAYSSSSVKSVDKGADAKDLSEVLGESQEAQEVQMVNILMMEDILEEEPSIVDRSENAYEEQISLREAVERKPTRSGESKKTNVVNRSSLGSYSPDAQKTTKRLLSRSDAMSMSETSTKESSPEPLLTIEELDHSASLRSVNVNDYRGVSSGSSVDKSSTSPALQSRSLRTSVDSSSLAGTSPLNTNRKSSSTVENALASSGSRIVKTSESTSLPLADAMPKTPSEKTSISTRSTSSSIEDAVSSVDRDAKKKESSQLSLNEALDSASKDSSSRKKTNDASRSIDEFALEAPRMNASIGGQRKPDEEDMVESVKSSSNGQKDLQQVVDEEKQSQKLTLDQPLDLSQYPNIKPLEIKDGKLVNYVRPEMNVSDAVKNEYGLKSDMGISGALDVTSNEVQRNATRSDSTVELDSTDAAKSFENVAQTMKQSLDSTDAAKSFENVAQTMRQSLDSADAIASFDEKNKDEDIDEAQQAEKFNEKNEIEKTSNAHKSNMSLEENISNSQDLFDDDEILTPDDELDAAQRKKKDDTKSVDKIGQSDDIDLSEKESIPAKSNPKPFSNGDTLFELNGQESQTMKTRQLSSDELQQVKPLEKNDSSEKSNMSLSESMDMMKNKKSDEDFEEIVEYDDELEFHKKIDTTNIVSMLKKSVLSNQKLDPDMHIDVAGILMKDRSITSEKYSILEQYSKVNEVDVRDVLKTYRGLSQEDLSEFVSLVQKSLSEGRESKPESPIEVSNGKLALSNVIKANEQSVNSIPAVSSNVELEVKNGKLVNKEAKGPNDREVQRLKDNYAEKIELKDSKGTTQMSHPVILPKTVSQDDIDGLF